jgi:uncharacterized membrane protein
MTNDGKEQINRLTSRTDIRLIALFALGSVATSLSLYIFFGVELTITFRVLFGLALVLFVPGYILCWLVFPDDKEISTIERLGLSFALSIPLVLLSVLVADNILRVTLGSSAIISIIVILMVILLVVGGTRRIIKAVREGKRGTG